MNVVEIIGTTMGICVSLAFLVSCYGFWFRANELQNILKEAFDSFPDKFVLKKFTQAYVQSRVFVWLGRIVTTVVVFDILRSLVQMVFYPPSS